MQTKDLYTHKHTHTFMTTKTITITEDAYRLLAREKNKDESFSELIKREFGKKRDLMEFVGLWEDISDKEADEMLEFIEKSKEETRISTKKRLEKYEIS